MKPEVSGLMSYLRRLSPPTDDGDGVLLERFGQGDQSAFAALLRRHAPLVWGVCRRVLPCAQDAEDAFQAVFLVLAHKSASLRRGEPLAPWLHRVAWRTAVKARARAFRRKSHESSAVVVPATPPSALERQETRRLLDEEIDRLPDRYRTAVTLCYLEGLSNEEAARRLGCPRGTVLSRLARARERLRQQLRRRGVDAPEVAAGGLLEALAASKVPVGLAEGVLELGVPSLSASALVKGVLLTMFIDRFKVAALFVLVALLAGTAAVWTGYRSPQSQAQATALNPVPPQKVQAPAPKTAAPEDPNVRPKKAKGPTKPDLITDRDLQQLLSQKADFQGAEGRDIKLVEVLDNLAKVYHFKYILNENAFAEDLEEPRAGVSWEHVLKVPVADPEPLPAMATSLDSVFRKLLSRIPARSGAILLIRKDHFEITTERAFRAELGMPAAKPGEHLLPLVHENFNEESPRTVLRKLASDSGYNVVLDPRAKSETKEITAKMMNTPVDAAVRVVADLMGLSVVRLGNIFYVTSAENAARLRKEWERAPVASSPGPAKSATEKIQKSAGPARP